MALGFSQYDYNDADLNRKHYQGEETPPKLDVNNMSANIKVSLLYGDKDEVLNQKCIDYIKNALGHRVITDIKLKNFVCDVVSLYTF